MRPQHKHPIPTIIRMPLLKAHTGLSRSSIYDKLNSESPRYDPSFPRPISLGAGAVGWVISEVASWLEARIAERKQAT